MKVTYIYPPLFKPFYPMATRILTENLLRNPHLEVEFSAIPVSTYQSEVDQKLYDTIMSKARSQFSPNVVAFMEQKYMVYNVFYVFMAHGYFDEYILEQYDTDIQIVSVLNFCDLLIVKHLLQMGKKVVLGGALINIKLSHSFVRRFLQAMGVPAAKLQENLIIVSGNIDLTTDLYAIISAWKDTEIRSNDYGTVYDCERDFLRQYYRATPSTPVHFGFNNRCWYGKCKFCTYRELPAMDFLTHIEKDRIVRYVHDMMQTCGSRQLRFIDSYYRCNSAHVEDILNQIADYNITIYTGIMLLKNKAYIEFINRHVNCLLIGLESTSDFSLKYVDKGYTYADIEMAVDQIIRYLNRDVFLEISIIVDLPGQDAADIRKNYEQIAALRERLANEGFKVAVHMNILSVFPNLELLYQKEGLLTYSLDPKDLDTATGKNHLIHILRKSGMDNPLQLPSRCVIKDEDNRYGLTYGYISSDTPVIRYDVNGNRLPSDLELMDEGIMKSILKRERRRLER
ncbi:MAG: hypothetical protein R6U38_10910 [Desulfatiglandaceae bacterium]